MMPLLSKLREASHSAIALIGAGSAGSGVILTFLNSVGVHVGQTTLDHDLALIGGVVVLVSKGIDSLNDALSSKGGVAAAVEHVTELAAPLTPAAPPPPPTQVPA